MRLQHPIPGQPGGYYTSFVADPLATFGLVTIVLLVLLSVYWQRTRNTRRMLALAASVSAAEIGAAALNSQLASWLMFGGPINGVIFIGTETLIGVSAYFLSFSKLGRKISILLGALLMLSSFSVGASLFPFVIPAYLMIILGIIRE